MSYDDILLRVTASVRERLCQLVTDYCRLSSVGEIAGFRYKHLNGRLSGHLAAVRLEENGNLLFKRTHDYDWKPFRSATDRQIMLFRSVRFWKVTKPFHPLEALANVAD